MKAVTEEELNRAGEALAGLSENHPVRRAIDTVIRNVQLELLDALGDEHNPADKTAQLAGQLAGTQLVEGGLLLAEDRVAGVTDEPEGEE